MDTVIRIQEQDFDAAEEYQQLQAATPKVGAIVTFTGLVREFDNGAGQALQLDYFPEMTETVLKNIVQQAHQQWPIINAHIIHRIGKLTLGEQIVFIGVSSAHREAAFNACQFIMDFLKTQAPFWKKALSTSGDYWVDAKDSDEAASKRWTKPS